jgi:Zn-dependent protease
MLISLLFSHPLYFFIDVLAIIISITIHEFSHAAMADRLGDPTAKLQGRVTLNPLAHLDPLGTLMIIIAGFGWGKPVIFDPYNLKNPRQDGAIIALAGPVSNLILAFLLSMILRFAPVATDLVLYLALPLITINVSLAIFNLIPIHPLDGGKILLGLAPKGFAEEWEEVLSNHGTLILLALILPLFNGTSAASYLITPIISFILRLFLGI